MKKAKEDSSMDAIERYLTEIFRTRKKVLERKVKLFRGCNYRGLVEQLDFCGNTDCHGCNFANKMINQAAKEWVDKNPVTITDEDFVLETTIKKTN